MTWEVHPTKNKKNKPGDPLWYRFRLGRHGEEGRVAISEQYATEADAIIRHNDLLRAYRPSSTALVLTRTLEQILPDFLEYYKNERRPRSVEAWLDGWHNLKPFFAKLKPHFITQGHIDRYKTHRLAQKAGKRSNLVCRRTVAKELSNLSAMITWAIKRQMCEPLPFKIEGFQKKQVQPRKKIIPTYDQVVKMLELARADVRPLYKLIYYAGLRSEEARMLKAKEVDLERNVILVTGKGDKQRFVPIAPQLRPILEQELKGKKPDDILMLSHRTGKPYTRNIGRLDAVAKRAGIGAHISTHTLRHAFGTHCVYFGFDIRTVQLLMGHSDIATTQTYTTLAGTFLASEMARFGQMAQRTT